MRLTENFTLVEFTRSETADRLGIDNTPSARELENIQRTADLLQRIRNLVGSPVYITSGFRCDELNRAVGGSPTSAHRLGYAADIWVPSKTPVELAWLLVNAPRFDPKIVWDQLICEVSRGVVHISSDPRQRGDVLTQAGPAGSPITRGLPDL